MEISGPCLECSCEGFAPAHSATESDEQLRERARDALDRVARMEEIVATLYARNGFLPLRSGLSVSPPPGWPNDPLKPTE
jgi:hypothetical protein